MKKKSLKHRIPKYFTDRTIRIHIGWIAFVAVLIWVGFFDSHSLYKRITWHHQAQALEAENIELQKMIDEIDLQLDDELTNETIERLARERYGMRQEGETVYPIKPVE